MKKFLLVVTCLTLILIGQSLAQQVDTLWTKHFDYTGGDDVPYGLAVDDSGNCYVTGQALNGYFAAATIKYRPNGDTAWVRIYQESGGSDEPQALTVDHSGNVYVTGGSWPTLYGYYNYLTIKYRPDGSQAWVASYGLPGYYDDHAYGVAVDGSGNVYVTGISDTTNAQSNPDIVTVKYSPLGDTLWTRRYDAAGDTDIGLAVAVDTAGNIIVAGASKQAGVLNPIVLKYSPSGALLWQKRYPLPVSISGYYQIPIHPMPLCVDAAGYVYVAANAIQASGDVLTIKYDPNGNQVWAHTYDNNGNDDYPRALAVDARGNVYVAGGSVASTVTDFALKYDAQGNLCWAASTGGHTVANGLALGRAGDVYVTGASLLSPSSDFFTLNYDSTGVQKWMVSYNGAASNSCDYAWACAADSSGNVWVTGQSQERYQENDFTTIKYGERTGVEENSGGRARKLEVRFKATPNPFVSFATVSGHEKERFSLYDVSGRKVGTYLGNRIGEGLAAGVYFLRPEGKDAKPVRIVKIR